MQSIKAIAKRPLPEKAQRKMKGSCLKKKN
jgi:hypothetical protein